jgi:8-oxo-dGTP pyrophosphatase MutT (NUDIX family)
MSRPMRTRTAVSAGGVILRDDDTVVLTARRSFSGQLQWGLPKGLVEAGESEVEAAIREAREETGLEVEVDGPLQTIDYWYVHPGRGKDPPTRVHKYVHYFLMRATGGDPSKHDRETEAVEFLPADHALTRASFASERDVIRAAMSLSQP